MTHHTLPTPRTAHRLRIAIHQTNGSPEARLFECRIG